MTRRPPAASRRHAALACLVVLAAALPVVAAAQSDRPTLTVSDAAPEPGSETTVRLSLDTVPAGLSGFEIRLELRSAGVATIEGASYPDRYRPTTDLLIGPDRRSITAEAADLGTEIQPGATNVTLATVTIAGNATGHTALAVTAAQVDDDDGGRIDPATTAGDVAVGVPTTTTTDAGGGGAAQQPATTDGPTTTGSGPGLGALSAVIALLATASLARRR